jgi:hypothetical protein
VKPNVLGEQSKRLGNSGTNVFGNYYYNKDDSADGDFDEEKEPTKFTK